MVSSFPFAAAVDTRPMSVREMHHMSQLDLAGRLRNRTPPCQVASVSQKGLTY